MLYLRCCSLFIIEQCQGPKPNLKLTTMKRLMVLTVALFSILSYSQVFHAEGVLNETLFTTSNELKKDALQFSLNEFLITHNVHGIVSHSKLFKLKQTVNELQIKNKNTGLQRTILNDMPKTPQVGISYFSVLRNWQYQVYRMFIESPAYIRLGTA